MLQIVQYQKNGEMRVEELAAPKCFDGGILVQTAFSLISAGTEKTSVTNAQGSLLERAKKQPDQVKLVLDTIKKQGLKDTFRRVQSKLDSFKTLGYSLSGVVVESQCDEFKVGDRVAAAGAGYANHAEFVAIPKNLAVKLPDNVSFEEAAYTTVASIAMQGVRQADPRLGETVAVIGLGLIGQITVQLLKAAGCRVIGLDVNEKLFDIAKKYGADAVYKSSRESITKIMEFSRGIGCDSVILTASTGSNEPIQLAMEICRPKGNAVIVGAVGLNLQRQPFYKKEINLKISSSYGPGRYDPFYEEYGNDYPVAYVRWTENRNMQSVIDLIEMGSLDVKSMTTHSFPIENASDAYNLITGKSDKKEDFLGILISYNAGKNAYKQTIKISDSFSSNSKVKVGFIGLGQFAQNYLMPPLKEFKPDFIAVATETPTNALSMAKQHNFAFSSTSGKEVIENKDVNTVFCATRHNSHSEYVISALKAKKAIFVEKPLAVNQQQLDEIKALAEQGGRVMVGFNRRFSKPFIKIKNFFAQREEPLVINYRVNAGMIPKSHWVHTEDNGGRIIGEACHFIDVMMFLTDSKPIRVYAESISASSLETKNADSVSVNIKFQDGSVGNLQYLANGDSSLPKEYCEVFGRRSTAIMNNFENVDLYSAGKKTSIKFDGDKGITAEVKSFLDAVQNGKEMPIDFETLYLVSKVTYLIHQSLYTGLPVNL